MRAVCRSTTFVATVLPPGTHRGISVFSVFPRLMAVREICEAVAPMRSFSSTQLIAA